MEETAPIIKRVDHVVLKLEGPGYIQLFQLFSDLFRLPIAWTVASYPPFRSAGIFAGNINLELVQFEDTATEATSSVATLAGIALEPYALETCLQDLKRRNIPYLSPIVFAYADENGTRIPYWTTVVLGNLLGSNQWFNAFSFVSKAVPSTLWQRASSSATTPGNIRTTGLLERALRSGMIFLCTYNPERYSIFEDRAANHAVLRARNGGPLGMEAIKEVVVGVSDFPTTNAHWHNLFVPEPPLQSGIWQLNDSPAIHLVSHEQNALLRMVWRVSSLEKARQFLREQDMLGPSHGEQITIAPEKIFGLDIRLVS